MTSRKKRMKYKIYKTIVWFCLFFLFIYQGYLFYNKKSNILGINSNLDVRELIELTNEEREKEGLSPLIESEKLSEAAEAKATEMLNLEYWDHISPTEKAPWQFIMNEGYDYHYAGENLAKNFTENKELIEAWMASPEHKNNIMSENYEDIGVAIVSGDLDGEETILIVQMFGTEFTDQDYIDAGYEVPRQFAENSIGVEEIKKESSRRLFNFDNKWIFFGGGILVGLPALKLIEILIRKKKFKFCN